MRPQSGSEAKLLLDHERAETPFVAFRDDAATLRVLMLDEDRPVMTIGRDPACDVALTWDGSVSRTHAVLERVGREWTIVDDGISTNGTYLNAARLTARRRLHDRDVLTFGQTAVEFRRSRSGSVGQTRPDRPLVAVPVTPMQRKVLVALCRPLLAVEGGFAAPATNADIAAELVLSADAAAPSHGLINGFPPLDLTERRAFEQRVASSRFE